MTQLYFIRHAQSDVSHPGGDRERPLTALGLEDRRKAAERLVDTGISVIISSPYLRAVQTVTPLAELLGLDIITDERLRERKGSPTSHGVEAVRRRWADFSYNEDGGENLADVQARNIAALRDILTAYANKAVAVGTHGTALSTILNFFDTSFTADGFIRLWHWMPYVIRLDFDGNRYIGQEEIFRLDRGY